MSPKASVTIAVPQSDRRPPRMKILEALQIARSQGAPLQVTNDEGVVQGRLTGGWVVDRRKVGINLVGACLLVMQPQPGGPDEDASAVLAREIGTPLAFVEGAQDGWLLETMNQHWLKVDRRAYLAGFFVGVEGIHAATLCCPACSTRRFKGEEGCPGCDTR